MKGLTAQHPNVDRKKRGSFLGLASQPILDHLNKIGVTTIQLMPVQAHLSERFLTDQGLTNYWGYQSIGFFAPDTRYLTQGGDLGIPDDGEAAAFGGDRGDPRCGL